MIKFDKQYILTLEELDKIPIGQRKHYYLDRSLLKIKEGFQLQSEGLVNQKAIEAAGIICRPFWDDNRDGKQLDSEGKAFSNYRKTHPGFSLMMRKTALEKLKEAQGALPPGLRIVLKASLRPIVVQAEVFLAELELTKSKHADWSDAMSYKHTLEYVTDPKVNIPPHASGGTIDIALWDEELSNYVDVGSPINAVDDSSWGDNQVGLSEKQKNMRNLLRDTMLDAGFANLASEWWHYSYGDQRWAVFYDQPQALYGAVEEQNYGW